MEGYQKSVSFSSTSHQHPFSISLECCLSAENRIQEILRTIQPVVASEERRKDIIDHICGLIRGYYGTEVFPFGSFPLKTYLPDGDIDLTVLCNPNVEEILAQDICHVLEGKAGKESKYQVTDVQYIRAQVKLVKCRVQKIAVDISFNQMAGLSTLCFLEMADKYIGKNHLFKRSVILIKAWCYYESRILGAHHGLLSTYGLETMVLHIVNVFHGSLCGPLAVLYKFLDYYSTFDWETYCVGITGPVLISSLPSVVTVTPEDLRNEFLLSEDFPRTFREMISDSTTALETAACGFPIKHLNILDPLKFSNNLGRSVNEGNFYRVRCALSYGAKKIKEIFMVPRDSMVEGLKKYFKDTLKRNGTGHRADVKGPIPTFGAGNFEVSDLKGDYDSCYLNDVQCDLWHDDHGLFPPSYRYNDIFVTEQPFGQPEGFQQGGSSFVVPQNRGSYIPISEIKSTAKLRGTGTFLPDYEILQDYSITEMNWSGERERDFKSHDWPLNKCENNDQLKASGTVSATNANDSNFNLSLEDFPMIRCCKMFSPMQIQSSGQPTLKVPEVGDLSPAMEHIEHRSPAQPLSAWGLLVKTEKNLHSIDFISEGTHNNLVRASGTCKNGNGNDFNCSPIELGNPMRSPASLEPPARAANEHPNSTDLISEGTQNNDLVEALGTDTDEDSSDFILSLEEFPVLQCSRQFSPLQIPSPGSHFNLSLKEFPVLQCSKKLAPQQIPSFSQPNKKVPNPGDLSPTMEHIGLGSPAQSSSAWGLSARAARKHPHSTDFISEGNQNVDLIKTSGTVTNGSDSKFKCSPTVEHIELGSPIVSPSSWGPPTTVANEYPNSGDLISEDTQNNDLLDALGTDPNKADNDFNCLVEEFPGLPSTKKLATVKLPSASWPTLKVPKAGELSPTSKHAELGTPVHSQSAWGRPAKAASKHPYSRNMVLLGTLPSSSSMVTRGSQELQLGGRGKMKEYYTRVGAIGKRQVPRLTQ